MREWGGSGIIALLLVLTGTVTGINYDSTMGWCIVIPASALWLCIAAFFRSPNREIPVDPTSIVSPADGVIKDVELVYACDWGFPSEEKMIRIGIFLSVLTYI